MKLLKIGDKVTHVDYPTVHGKILRKEETWGLQNYVVLWNNSGQSWHTSKALKKVS